MPKVDLNDGEALAIGAALDLLVDTMVRDRGVPAAQRGLHHAAVVQLRGLRSRFPRQQ